MCEKVQNWRELKFHFDRWRWMGVACFESCAVWIVHQLRPSCCRCRSWMVSNANNNNNWAATMEVLEFERCSSEYANCMNWFAFVLSHIAHAVEVDRSTFSPLFTSNKLQTHYDDGSQQILNSSTHTSSCRANCPIIILTLLCVAQKERHEHKFSGKSVESHLKHVKWRQKETIREIWNVNKQMSACKDVDVTDWRTHLWLKMTEIKCCLKFS